MNQGLGHGYQTPGKMNRFNSFLVFKGVDVIGGCD
jgi:hypothetical protein